MKSIDERIVDLQLNNEDFEQGVRESLGSVRDLKEGLDSTNSIGLTTLQQGLSTVTDRFTALGVMGVTALTNITNKAVDVASRLMKSITVEPITEGLTEYELKLNTMQAVMSATGLTTGRVTDELARLDEYADKTVYSTADMFNNITRFTNVGVPLDEAATAMIGIANATAIAGGGAAEAQRAMFNLGQSISNGFLMRADYNSLQLANIATTEFNQTLIDAALSMGQLTDVGDGYYETMSGSVINATKNFEASLKDEWATTEVMTEALRRYGDATTELGKKGWAAAQDIRTFTQLIETIQAAVGTGWARTFELLIGDFDEAKALWTEVNGVISTFIDNINMARNNLLGEWKELGGRTALLDAIKNTFGGIMSVLTPIRDAFREIFPPATAQQLLKLTETLRDFTANLRISDETADKLRRTFAGLFAVGDIIGQFFSSLGKVIFDAVSAFAPIGDGFLGITAHLGDLLVGLSEALKTGEVFDNVFSTIADGVKRLVSAIQNDIKGMMESPAFSAIINVISKFGDALDEGLSRAREAMMGFKSLDMSGVDEFGERIEEGFRPLTFIATLVGGAFTAIKNVFMNLLPFFSSMASVLGDIFGDAFRAIADAFESGGLQGVLNLINSGLFAGILLGIKNFIDPLKDISSNASSMLEGITEILDGVRGSLEAWQQNLQAKTLLTIAAAIGVLSLALIGISLIDPERLTGALVAITTLFVDLAASLQIMSSGLGGTGVAKVAAQLTGISIAILLLSAALTNIASLNSEDLKEGLIGIGVMAAELVAAAKILSSGEGAIVKGGAGLVLFASSLLILSQAVEQLAAIDAGAMTQGLIGVGIIMAELVAFTKLANPTQMASVGFAMIELGAALNIMVGAITGLASLDPAALAAGLIGLGVALGEIVAFTKLVKPDHLLSTGVAMIVLGAAMVILAEAVGVMGNLGLETMVVGLVGMAGALGILVGALTLMPSDIGTKAVGLIALSAALAILAQAMQAMGSMSWEEVATSLVVLAGSLTVITIAMNAMTGGLPGAAAMLVMSAAILTLTPALMALGSMSLEEIGLALLALVGVFGVLGGAALLLAPITPAILALSASIALLGVGALAVGAGVLAFSAGLAALAVSGTAAVATLTLAITSIASLIPFIIEQMGVGIVAFAKVISDGAPAIADAIASVALALIATLDDVIPPFLDSLFGFVDYALEKVLEYIKPFTEAGMKIIIGFLAGISEHMEELVTIALEMIENFMQGLANGIPGIVASAIDIVNALLESIGKEVPRLVDAGFQMMIDFMNGIADAIRENLPLLIEAFANIGSAIIDGLIEGILGGIGKIGTTLLDGISKAYNSVLDFLGIRSPSRLFRDMIGKNMVLGTAQGIDENSSKVEKAAKKMADNAYQEAKRWIEDYQNDENYLATEELAMWEALGERFQEYSEEKVEIEKKIRKLRESIRKDEYNSFKKDIDRRRKLNRITTDEEIALWQQVYDTHAFGADARLEAEERLYELEQEQIKARQEMMQAGYDADRQIIDDRVKMEELTIADQIATWELMQKKYGENVEFRREAELELFDLNKQLLEEEKRLNEELIYLEQEYNDSLNQRVEAIKSSYGLFDEVEDKEEIAGKTLIQNLEDQITALRDWADNLDILAEKGVEEGLLQELQMMGPSAAAEIDALAKLSAPELDKYGDLWEEKTAIAMSRALKEHEEYAKEIVAETARINEEIANLSISTIDPIIDTADTPWLDDMVKKAQEAYGGVNYTMKGHIKSSKETGIEVTEAYAEGLAEPKRAVTESAENVVDWSEAPLEAAMDDFALLGESHGIEYATQLNNKHLEAYEAGKKVSDEAQKGLKEEIRQFREIGQEAGRGFAEGMLDEQDNILQIARNIAEEAANILRFTLDINSPSRVTREIGMFTGLGFAQGMLSTMNTVRDDARILAESAVVQINNAIDRVLSSDDYSPTITPIMDMTNIQNGIGFMREEFGQTFVPTTSSRLASMAVGTVEASRLVDPTTGETVNPSMQFIQNNYSPKALTRLEIYRQTNNQFARFREAVSIG